VILVDSNVFLIDLRYPRDLLFGVNRRFLERLALEDSGATTLFNLLELAGILSFNLNRQQVLDLLCMFPEQYRIAILPPLDLETNLPRLLLRTLVSRIAGRCAFGDALVMEAIERYAPQGSLFVTWDAKHFAGRTTMQVATPKQALKAWDARRR